MYGSYAYGTIEYAAVISLSSSNLITHQRIYVNADAGFRRIRTMFSSKSSISKHKNDEFSTGADTFKKKLF